MSEETKHEEAQVGITQQPESVEVDLGTAFSLKLQEFDKKISEAEFVVYDLKKQKASYIYDENVKQVVMSHREKVMKAQIEDETRKKLADKK